MKRALLILLLGAALAAAGYTGVFWAATAPARAEMCSPAPELAWLKAEFKIDDTQFARISQLHEGYLPQCQERCREIASKNAALSARIAQTGAVTADIEKGMTEVAMLKADCQKETLRHFMAVARLMPPAQGQRYLQWVLGQTFPCHSTATNAACHMMSMQ
ncbi:MAG TPA: hypothetical protein VHB20_03410 [Verrucomicrobiae bacterium]|jgi:hypothetical protein|nr:hypothetical protein [Verrucomicrobiae bacterium]